ncbi:unnamed protein product, partial [Rotaria sp. Silwood2]
MKSQFCVNAFVVLLTSTINTRIRPSTINTTPTP